jgi:hypothetical protein
MNRTQILSLVFFIGSIILAFFLYNNIKFKIDEEKRIAAIEDKVIEKLKMIRDAQIAYQAVNGKYTADWDKLINFADTGRFYIVQKSEILELLEYGAEKVITKIDTLGTVSIKDSLFNEKKYPNLNLQNLPIIPGSNGKKFELFADKIVKAGVKVDVFEAKDVAPVNPKRKANNNEKALRVGSRTDVTTSGNWE